MHKRRDAHGQPQRLRLSGRRQRLNAATRTSSSRTRVSTTGGDVATGQRPASRFPPSAAPCRSAGVRGHVKVVPPLRMDHQEVALVVDGLTPERRVIQDHQVDMGPMTAQEPLQLVGS